MRRIVPQAIVFSLICVMFLAVLGLMRSDSVPLVVIAGIFVVMLVPGLIVGIVDIYVGRWSILAGIVLTPLTFGAVLYEVANPRLLESLYLALAGAFGAAACSWLSVMRETR